MNKLELLMRNKPSKKVVVYKGGMLVPLGEGGYNFRLGDMVTLDKDSKVFNKWPKECSSIISNALGKPSGVFSDTIFGMRLKQIK